VAQRHGLTDLDVAVAVVAEVVQVGAAQPGGLDGYQDLVWLGGWEGALFLEDEGLYKRVYLWDERLLCVCGTYYPEVFGPMEHGGSNCLC
jgi:hypothetical protein